MMEYKVDKWIMVERRIEWSNGSLVVRYRDLIRILVLGKEMWSGRGIW